MSILIAISIASERLVEIVRNLTGLAAGAPVPAAAAGTAAQPDGDAAKAAEKKEEKRKAKVQLIAIGSGILTASLASPAILSLFPALQSDRVSACSIVVVMGVFASSGSAFWKEALVYVRNVREIRGAEAEDKKLAARNAS
ncbi:MAG: hypothetical protein V4726_00235 [Verrucomicrobiota bacterium]